MRRLLNGRIRYIAEKNVVQAKKFSEMLEASVIQYQKRSLETAEVIQALVDMARDMNELSKRGNSLGCRTTNWHFMMQFLRMNLQGNFMKTKS